MRTLIINGSPRGKNGNTEVFIRQFLEGAGEEYPVRYVVKEDPLMLAEVIREYDTVLFFMPLYVHAMPGIVMKLFEQMKTCREGQRIGFVVQAGFIEGAQARFLVRYLKQFALLRELGAEYAVDGRFNRDTAASLAGIHEISSQKARVLTFLNKIGADHTIWKKFWRDNGQSTHGMDRPFI